MVEHISLCFTVNHLVTCSFGLQVSLCSLTIVYTHFSHINAEIRNYMFKKYIYALSSAMSSAQNWLERSIQLRFYKFGC